MKGTYKMEELKEFVKLVKKHYELKKDLYDLTKLISAKIDRQKIAVLGKAIEIEPVFNHEGNYWLRCVFVDYENNRNCDILELEIKLKILELNIDLYIYVHKRFSMRVDFNRLCEIKQAFIEALEKIGLKAE